jgi:type VI secretion system ImpA family protein
VPEDLESLDKPIQMLLHPIPGKHSAGKALIYDPAYDEIQGARTAEDANLPQGIWQRPIKKVDWNRVESLCMNALTTQSKDLQIAAWLVESWIHLYGLKGLINGLGMIHELCEKYWESLYPLPRDNDMEFRFSPFEWMNEKILIILRMFPITSPASERAKSYTLLDWQSASQLAGMTGIAQQNMLSRIQKEGGVTRDQFNTSRDATPTEYYQNIRIQAQQLLDVIQSLNEFIHNKNPAFSGVLHHIRDEVKNIMGFADVTLSTRGITSAHPDTKSMQEESLKFSSQSLSPSKGISMEQKLSGPVTISSREEAYSLLDQVATYLSTIEPHSPTPLLIRRAIAWGQMSLSEVLQELVQDKNDFLKVQNLLGIPKKNTE